MLPVFRLPEVSNNPAGGFLRRLPREETQRERECRIKEAEELEKMKTALGLTDRELEALEEELLPQRGRGSKSPAVAAARSLTGDRNPNDGLDLEKDPQDVLYGPDSAFGKQKHQQPQPQQAESLSAHPLGGKRRRRGAGRRTADSQPRRDKSRWSPIRQQTTALDLPTPRVLRRIPHSTLGAELAASKALSVRRTGEGKKTGPWTSTGEIGLGISSGSVLGTTMSTEQLVAAAADVGMLNLLELRRELGRSVGQVRCLARAVKLDVQEVTQLCPVQHPRAVRFLRRWACERLATLADEILVSRVAAALERWRRAAAAMAMAMRKKAYLRYQGSSKLMFSLDKAYLRRLAKGWVQWGVFVEAERAREHRVLEQSAAVMIQRAVRGFHARRLRAWLTIVAQDRQRHLAAVTVTRYAKGKVARMRYARVKAGIERVAVSLQKLYRGRAGRRLFLAITKARRERLAATKIQAITRGKWGRQRAESLVRKIREDAAAQHIQQAARAWLARRLVKRLREEELRSRAIRSIAALNIQRVYRGHRTRVLHGARLEMKRSRQRGEDAAATKIQALVRAHLSKRTVAKLAKKRKERRISDARLWTETWSEDAQMWFYHNASTGEALWEPPSTGYTKHDGALVLASGEVVRDPEEGMTEEERMEARKQSSCVECEQKRSTRKCDQCGDGFCTRCFRKTHASGRRTKHTWTHVGPMECAECEAEVATKWCTACDDPFCAPCWSAIHSRGKRSLHSHCTISPGGRVSTKAIAPDGTDAGPFTPGESLVAETAGAVGYGGGDGAAATAAVAAEYGNGKAARAAAPLVEVESSTPEWQSFADDDGNPYWYNSVSGVSQYENPLGGPAWTGGSITTASEGEGQAFGRQAWDTAQQAESDYLEPDSGALVAAQGSTGEWSEHVDDHGNTYYYSSLTGEKRAALEHTLGEYHDQHAELSSSLLGGRRQQGPQYVMKQRKQIKLKVQHTPIPQQLVACTVQGGEGRGKLRPATVQLPNTATFGELLELAREKRYGGLEFEGPVHGALGELDTSLRDAWVRNGCKIDGTLHIGLAVVVSFPAGSQKSLSLVMGPRDTVNDVKRETEAGCIRVSGGGSGSVGDRLSSGPGGTPRPIVVFGLSPSGRVFTLSTRGGATVLEAKGLMAIFEGVSPCRQRLLCRGGNLEPDGAPLHELGVRNGDTLVVGYKLELPGVTASAAEQEGNVSDGDDDTLVAEVMDNQRHYAPEDENCVLSSGANNGNELSAESPPPTASAEAAANGDENNAAVVREHSTAAPASADARARDNSIDVAGGEGGGRGAGGDSAPLLPAGSAAGQGNEKAG
eukprot:g15293.t1